MHTRYKCAFYFKSQTKHAAVVLQYVRWLFISELYCNMFFFSNHLFAQYGIFLGDSCCTILVLLYIVLSNKTKDFVCFPLSNRV